MQHKILGCHRCQSRVQEMRVRKPCIPYVLCDAISLWAPFLFLCLFLFLFLFLFRSLSLSFLISTSLFLFLFLFLFLSLSLALLLSLSLLPSCSLSLFLSFFLSHPSPFLHPRLPLFFFPSLSLCSFSSLFLSTFHFSVSFLPPFPPFFQLICGPIYILIGFFSETRFLIFLLILAKRSRETLPKPLDSTFMCTAWCARFATSPSTTTASTTT